MSFRGVTLVVVSLFFETMSFLSLFSVVVLVVVSIIVVMMFLVSSVVVVVSFVSLAVVVTLLSMFVVVMSLVSFVAMPLVVVMVVMVMLLATSLLVMVSGRGCFEVRATFLSYVSRLRQCGQRQHCTAQKERHPHSCCILGQVEMRYGT